MITHNGNVVISDGKALTFGDLISVANAATGKSDTTLSSAVSSLLEGYGGRKKTGSTQNAFSGNIDNISHVSIPFENWIAVIEPNSDGDLSSIYSNSDFLNVVVSCVVANLPSLGNFTKVSTASLSNFYAMLSYNHDHGNDISTSAGIMSSSDIASLASKFKINGFVFRGDYCRYKYTIYEVVV